MNTDSYVHNINPYLIHWNSFKLPWYWFFYCVGAFLVLFYCERFLRNHPHYLKKEKLYTILMFIWPMLFLGGRLGYVFFYNWTYYQKYPEKIFAFWEGGMSFHGALLLVLLTIYYLSRKLHLSFFKITDLLALPTPLALGLGRIGNFINGELAGTPSNVAWAIIFPRYDMRPRHPSQLYEALSEGLVLFILLHWKKNQNISYPGKTTGLFLIAYGVFRFFIEFFRLPDPQIGRLYLDLSLGQYFCLAMIAIGTLIYTTSKRTLTS